MVNSPLKTSYNGGGAPKGVPAIGLHKGNGNQTAPSVMKGNRAAGEKYKKPADTALRGKGARNMSSSNTGPTKQSASDKNRYTQAKQPTVFSNNGPKATKFVN